jgi:uncharacterized surface protein with fasciclin (FAS1) repeats
MKHIISKIAMLTLVCGLFAGCYDSDNVGENFYTFTGETIGSFLEKSPETYNEFTQAVQKAGLTDLLKSYNQFTCFVPTNEAMQTYYSSLNVSSLAALSDSVVRYMVYSHLIPEKVYQPSDFVEGALSFTNMNSRYLVIGFQAQTSSVTILINSNSAVLENAGVENGIIYTINHVLTPSTAAVPTILGNDERITLFAEALEATGLSDSLQLMRDDSYVPETDPLSIDNKTICRSPKERKFGYTCFVESNEVFANTFTKSSKAVTDLETLKEYAADVYDAVYPEDAGISDVRNRRNSLNRFIAYHLIDKTVNYNNFFYNHNTAAGITLYEFMETMCPNTIFRCSNENGGIVINSDPVRGVQGVTVLPTGTGREQDTENGVYHLIDKPLVYNQAVKTMLLNTRIRLDATSLHPELMTNGIRYEKGNDPSGVTGDNKYYKFPDKYLKNVQFISNNTRMYYLQGSSGWANYQADEMMAMGQFDFIIRFPPVPAGTYEVRFGYTANTMRGILQFYVDDASGELIPRGIPLNMKRMANDPVIGWDNRTSDDDASGGLEIDKMLRNRGYMKGPECIVMKDGVTGRFHGGALRRIVCVETWDKDAPHYIRFKSVSDTGSDQFMMDYFELVPKNVYENPNGQPESRE